MSERAWATEIKDIGDKIAALTVSKAVELGDYLEEVHKIKPAAGGGGAVMVAPAAAVAEKKEEPTEFKVILEGFDPAKKINVINVVREITGLGHHGAHDAAEGAPHAAHQGSRHEAPATSPKPPQNGREEAPLDPK